MRLHGVQVLGAGSAQYLMYKDEISQRIREICDSIRREHGKPGIWDESGAAADVAVSIDEDPARETWIDTGFGPDVPDAENPFFGEEGPDLKYILDELPDEEPDEPLEAKAVSVRLRRLWLDTLVPLLKSEDHDLAEVSFESCVDRVGGMLMVTSVIDFGAGEPFSRMLRLEIQDLLCAASNGLVSKIEYRYTSKAIPKLQRKRSGALDVFHPGDVEASTIEEIATRLTKVLDSSTEIAQAALANLTVAGVSRHRIWLAVNSDEARRRISMTPGAGGSLAVAIGRIQGKEEPKYDIVVDPEAVERYPGILDAASGDLSHSL